MSWPKSAARLGKSSTIWPPHSLYHAGSACDPRDAKASDARQFLWVAGIIANKRLVCGYMPRRLIVVRGQRGLDNRHRDEDGEISRKRSDTLVGTLRHTYGDEFLSDFRSDATLGTVLK